MPWIKREVRDLAKALEIHTSGELTKFMAYNEGKLRVRSGAYAFLQIPCVPFEVFLQWGFGNMHLAFSFLIWGIVYPIWFFFFHNSQLSVQAWQFWPTAGVVVSALCWLHMLYGIADKSNHSLFEDQARSEGIGRSIPWNVLMFVLSIFVRRLRGPVRYPAIRRRWYNFMDYAVTLIGHWVIAWYAVNHFLDTRPHPEWLGYTIMGCLYYYAFRNFILIFVVAANASGIKSADRMAIETQILAEKNMEMLDEIEANQAAASQRDRVLEERRQGVQQNAAPPSRVVSAASEGGADPAFCGACGKQIAGTKFCTSCGTKVGA